MLIHPEFKKAYEKSTDADPYYVKKCTYLKKHDFFSKPSPINFGTIDEFMVKNNITQTPQIVFETTDFCNLDCAYCSFGDFYEGFDIRNRKNINTSHAITLLKYIFDVKHKSENNKLAIGFYGGEPLFNENFIKQIVEVVNQLNAEKDLDIQYNLTTNATLLHKNIHFLVEHKFQLLISLDGNEINHSYRFFRENKKNSFKKVIENIDMVQRNYPEYFTNNIKFNAVLHNRNSVKDIYEFIYSRYHKIPRIAELAPNDMSPDRQVLYNRMYHNKRKSEAKYLMEESNQLPHEELLQYAELIDFLKYYSINYYISNITDLLPGEKKNVPTNTCLPFWKKIMLTTSGKLTPCEKVNYHKFFIGEVNENVMIDIPEITRRYQFYHDHVKKKCQHCYVNKSCGVCLFLIKNNNLDKLDTEEFDCEEFHDLDTFQNKLYRVISFLEKYPKDFSQIIENVVII
jgi:uncharacterized protein